MKKAARAIVVDKQNILLIKRNKFGLEYYTLPGGGVEMGETADQAVVRELKEETNLDTGTPRLVYVEDSGEPYGTQYVFTCEHKDGDMHLQTSAIEHALNQDGKNTYYPVWVPISKFAALPFRSRALQDALLRGLREGWPQEPELLKSQAEISGK